MQWDTTQALLQTQVKDLKEHDYKTTHFVMCLSIQLTFYGLSERGFRALVGAVNWKALATNFLGTLKILNHKPNKPTAEVLGRLFEDIFYKTVGKNLYAPGRAKLLFLL